jgi:hypothetical protein
VAPEAWSWAALGGQEAVAARRARALSDEGDDPRLTDTVGPPVSEREPTAKSDKRSRQRPKRASGAGNGRNGQAVELDKRPNQTSTPGSLTGWAHLSARGRRRPKWTSGGVGPRLGWKIREETGPTIKEKEFLN